MSASFAQQNFCLRLNNPQVSQDLSKLQLDVEIIAGDMAFLLGSGNYQFTFDNTILSSPTLVSTSLMQPTYSQVSVSEPEAGGDQASVNVAAALVFNGFNPTISTEEFFTIARIEFTINDNSSLTNFTWTYDGSFAKTVQFTGSGSGDSNTQLFAQSEGSGCLIPLQNIALPIKMKSFTAVPFENRDANLNWSTASEVNGSHFEIERSDEGVNFAQIGRVEATGNSSVDQDYKFSDREVNMQRASDLVKYYRIKLVDIDGEYKYSGIRVVNFTRSDIDFTVSAFPNPTINYVQLELTGLDNTSEDRPMLNIYSNTGELVRSERLNSDLGKIDMSNLPGSLYHFIIDYKGQRYTEKIVVIK